MRIIDAGDGAIWLGRQGENLATRIRFDTQKITEAFGAGGTFALFAKRRTDTGPYPVVVSMEDSHVVWNVTEADSAVDGVGMCELRYYLGNVLAKTMIWTTKVSPSIDGADTEPPEPQKAWVDQVLETAQDAAASSADAAASAAEARATEEAIRATLTVADEMGSTFNSQNELYLYHQSIKDKPEYTYHFADEDYIHPSFRYTVTNNIIRKISSSYCYMLNRLIDYDDSLVIHIPPGIWNSSPGTAQYAIVLGQVENGEFVPSSYVSASGASAFVYGARASGINVNLRYYRVRFQDPEEGKVLLQIYGSATTMDMLKSIKISKRNPYAELDKVWEPGITNDASKRLAPRANSTSVDGNRKPTTLSVAGRLPTYWSTRLTRKTVEKKSITHAAGDTTTVITPEELDASKSEQFVMAYEVIVWGTTKKALYSSKYSVAADGTLTINGIAHDGANLKTSAANNAELITQVSYEYVISTLSPKARITRKPCHQWLYAGGLGIDAIFYDKNGSEITWYDDGSGPLAASVNGCLNLNNSGKLYPTSIKIPAAAVSYHFAVSGPPYVTASGNPADLCGYFGEKFPDICVLGKADHLPICGLYKGRAVTNARKLINWKYPVEMMSLRNVVIGYFDGAFDAPSRTVTGVPYATGSNIILGSDISYYTFLSFYRRQHGTLNGTTDSWARSSNAYVGYMCAAFAAACCGLAHHQGVEYWVHKYADKLEPVSGDTILNPGDLTLYFKYKRKRDESENLYSHVTLINDGIFNQKTGEFSFYERAECAEAWTRLGRFTADKMGSCYDNPNYDAKTVNGVTTTGVYKTRLWRLPMPMEVPDISDSYVYSMDKLTDPINNPVIEFPPVVSNLGDRCIVGNAPNGVGYSASRSPANGGPAGYSSRNVGYVFYTLKTHQKIVVNRKYRDEIDQTYDPIIANGSSYSGNFFYSFDLSSIMTTNGLPNPGVYTITAYDSEDNAAAPAVFLIPEHPGGLQDGTGIAISNGSKIVTISGAHIDSTGALSCKSDDNDNVSFNDIWVRVIPKPATVPAPGGGTETLPWGNYMYVPGSEIWDGEKINISAEGSPYDRIVGLSLRNTDFGGLRYRFSNDHNGSDDSDGYQASGD